MDTNSLLNERATQYGDFSSLAQIACNLKWAMHTTAGWKNLSPMQQEALDMVQHKVARILNGNPNIDDHWEDIAGYAKLPLKYKQKQEKELYSLGNDLPEYLQGISDIL